MENAIKSAGQELDRIHLYQKTEWDKEISKTGYSALDNILGGGIFPRLYVVGGDTSTGKTTFALNLANRIAEAGRTVLFFTMEQTVEEMIARSLSRQTALCDQNSAWTENQILYYSKAEDRQRERAQRCYREAEVIFSTKAGKHLFFIPGRRAAMGLTVEQAEATTATEGKAATDQIGILEYAEILGRGSLVPPVVIVDYLQIMRAEPGSSHLTEREQINQNIENLLKLKDQGSPVIAISSYNRSSYYKEEAGNAAFKGSGEIEYSADCLMFLSVPAEKKTEIRTINGKRQQIEVEDQAAFRKSMGEDTRKIHLTVTKNRGAKYGGETELDYTPKYNLFEGGHIEYI